MTTMPHRRLEVTCAEGLLRGRVPHRYAGYTSGSALVHSEIGALRGIVDEFG